MTKVYFLIFILVLSHTASAAEKARSKKRTRPTVEKSAPAEIAPENIVPESRPRTKARKAVVEKAVITPAAPDGEVLRPPIKTPNTKAFKQFHGGVIFWQEKIKAKDATEAATMLAHFQGLEFTYAYNKFIPESFWRWSYRGSLMYGDVKGKINGSALQDHLKDQTFIGVGITPALIYRTATVSEVGFTLPLTFRGVKWKANEGVDIEKRGSFSAGLGLIYINRFTRRSSMYATVSHQVGWSATQFGLGWTHTFKY